MTSPAGRYRFEPFTLDPFGRVVSCSDEIVSLAPKAVDVLVVLVERAGKLVGKRELLERAWPDAFVEEANLSVQISALRKALGDQPDGRPYVETVPRRGYRFTAKVDRLPPSTPRSLAVLPWRPLNLAAEEDFLCVGLADALITRLSSLGQILVRPTSAVLRYAGEARTRELPQIARELNVDVVLDGYLQRMGSRLRATAQLVRAADGVTLWADQFEPEATDLLGVQDAIVEPLSRALLLHVGENERAKLRQEPTRSPDAYHCYLRGRYFWNKLTGPWLLKARKEFERAVALDPDYAHPHAGLADTSIALGLWGIERPRDAWRRANISARHALSLMPSLAEAHVALAYATLFDNWSWSEADHLLRQAVALNPRSAGTRIWLALFLAMRGHLVEAFSEVVTARSIDPLSLTVNIVLGLQLYFAARSDEKIEQHKRTLDLEPDFAIGHWALGLACAQRGQYEDAISAQQRACELTDGNLVMKAVLARYMAMNGQKDPARTTLAELNSSPPEANVSHYQLATIHAALGEVHQAFECLFSACEEMDHWLVWLKVDPLVAELRSDPRFPVLLRRVGL